ncbi:MAG: 3-hydroxyacyl-CoA dehydrogenase [Tistlia sp.]|uniref:3-hydroxyacyl-CoA dehydrogenase n=1 Tax=Tistlia sp. TaxID=3057121 RepID=UPI0034A47813
MTEGAAEATARVAVVGAGLIGRSWAVVFARAGHQVRLFDQDGARVREALDWIGSTLAEMQGVDLLGDAAATAARVAGADTLAEAVAGAAWVQECTLERIEEKRAVFAELDRAAPPEAVLASSSSGLVPSGFTEALAGRHRCLLAHPINPPHLVPLVEIVGAPWTGEAVIERAMRFQAAAGQKPIRVGEIAGFVVNRLQGALLDEAFRLVEQGHASPDDVDRAMVHGLAQRWSFIGPFETIDLNAPAGVEDYAARYGTMYFEMHRERGAPKPWDPSAVERVAAARRASLPLERLPERQAWRDSALMRRTAARAPEGS